MAGEKMKPINNTSDQASDYSGDLLKADTLEKLLKMLNDYRSIAADALDSAPSALDWIRRMENV